MEECDSEVLKSEDFCHVGPSFVSVSAREYLVAFRSVIACCKCHVQQLLGNTVLALQLAQQSVQLAHGSAGTPYVPVITGLAHVLKFLHEHDSPVLVDGVKLLRSYCHSLSHNPYTSLSCESFDPSTVTNTDQLNEGDLYSIQIFCSLPSPLSFSPLSFLRTYSLVDEDSDDAQSNAPYSTLSFHYSTQGCGMLDEPTLPMDPLFLTLNDPMVVDEWFELKQIEHHQCTFEDGSSGNVQSGEVGEIEDFVIVV